MCLSEIGTCPLHGSSYAKCALPYSMLLAWKTHTCDTQTKNVLKKEKEKKKKEEEEEEKNQTLC